MSELVQAVTSIVGTGPENPDTGKDEGVFSKIKQIFNDLINAMNNKEYAFDVFEKNLLFLKSFGFALLIILAIVNYVSYKDVGLISQKPGLFAAESAVFGLAGAVPFAILCYLRNKDYFNNKQVAVYSVAIFILFFIVNYILELDGLYAATFYEQTAEQEKAAEAAEVEEEHTLSYTSKLAKSLGKTSGIVVLIIFAVSMLCLIFAAVFVKDFSPSYIRFTGINQSIVFFIEMLIFGVISAVPIFFMASNRKALSSSTWKEFGLITVKFAALHCLLQASGFYTYIFTGMKPK